MISLATINVNVNSEVKKEADDIVSGKVQTKTYNNVEELFKDLDRDYR